LPTAPTMPTIEESTRGSEIVIGNTGWIVSGNHFPLNCRSVAGIAATTSFDTEKT
jgi:hypothetical protein